MTGPGDGQAYAGFWIRVVARLIDVVILIFPALISFALQGWLLAGADSMDSNVVTAIIFLMDLPVIVVPPLYLTFLWSRRGATVGQGLLGLRVVEATTGGRITLVQAWVRFFGQVVDIMFLGLPIGLVVAAFDEHKQAWHDRIAGTVVLRPGHPGPYVPSAFVAGHASERTPDGAEGEWRAQPVGTLRERLLSPLPDSLVLVVTVAFWVLMSFICFPGFALIVLLQSWSWRTKLIVILLGLAFDVAVLGPQMIHECHFEGSNIWCQSNP